MAREAVISTSALNAYGTRILTEGLDIEQYKKNPIVLYMHRRGSREDMQEQARAQEARGDNA